MNFADEEYVRLYVADTVTWRVLTWETRSVLVLSLRKFDHAGVFEFGRHGAEKALAAAIGVPVEIVTKAVSDLITEEVWELESDRLFWPKYVEAQTCKRSDRLRQRMSRAARSCHEKIENRDQGGGDCDSPSQGVTSGHVLSQVSQPVTVCHPLAGKGEGEAGQAREGQGSESGSRSSQPEHPPRRDRFGESFGGTKPESIELFEAWKFESGKLNATMDHKRVELFGRLALEGVTKEQVTECVRGAKLDDWAVNTAKLSPSAILGSAEQREKYTELAKSPPKPTTSEPIPPYYAVDVPETPEQYTERVKRECAKSLAYMARQERRDEAERARMAAIRQKLATGGKAAPQ